MTAQATVRRRTSKKKQPRSTRRAGKHAGRGAARSWLSPVIALVLALLAASVWSVYFSTALVTKRVSVVGTHDLTPMQVSFAAQVPLGVPLARQDLDAIAERTTTLPPVESAAVTRDWPSTIRITVVERRPVLAVRQPDGYVVVDKSGVGYQTKHGDAARRSCSPRSTPEMHRCSARWPSLRARCRKSCAEWSIGLRPATATASCWSWSPDGR